MSQVKKTSGQRLRSNKPKKQDRMTQARRFREAAREAGVDENADIDEVMRRLAAQEKPQKRGKKGKSSKGSTD